MSKVYEMVSLSVRVPLPLAEEIGRVADGLGVRRGHYYAVCLATGFRLMTGAAPETVGIFPGGESGTPEQADN